METACALFFLKSFERSTHSACLTCMTHTFNSFMGALVERVRFSHVYIPFNALHPRAWRGDSTLRVFAFGRVFRLSFAYRPFSNDWRKVDTARSWDVSPRFAKWFNVCSYYAGMHRNMYHLHVGRVGFSVIPATSIHGA